MGEAAPHPRCNARPNRRLHGSRLRRADEGGGPMMEQQRVKLRQRDRARRGRCGSARCPGVDLPPRFSRKPPHLAAPDRALLRSLSLHRPRSARLSGIVKAAGGRGYTPDKLIGDIFLLAAELGRRPFHHCRPRLGRRDCLGRGLDGPGHGRVTRAMIANAPHPVMFPKLLYTNPHQREASQYIRGFPRSRQ